MNGSWNEVKLLPWKTTQRDSWGNTQVATGFVPVTLPQFKSSSRVPGWKQRIARSQPATGGLSYTGYNNLSCNRYDYYSYGDLTKRTWRFHEGSGMYSGSVPGFPNFSDPGWNYAVNQAKMSWVRKLRALQQSVSAMATMGEAHSSRELLESRGRQILDKMSSYMDDSIRLRKKHGIKKGRRLRSLGSYLQDQNGLYLEYTFGWQPLVADTVDWSKELEDNPFRGFREIQNLLAKFSHVTKASDLVAWSGYSLAPLSWHREGVLTYSVKYYGAFLMECLVNARLRGAGLYPGDFIPSLYELLPWSWAIDYFSNLGTIVNSLSTMDTRLAWTQTTSVIKKSMTCSGPSYQAYPGFPDELSWIRASYGGDVANTYQATHSGTITLDNVVLTRSAGMPTDMTPELELRMPSADQAFDVASAFSSRYKVFQKLL